jgi:hypothetical protein
MGNYFGSALFIILAVIGTLIYVLRYDPIKDFRPFAVGNDLKEKMADGQLGVFDIQYQIKNLKTGEIANYTQKDYLNNAALWDTKNYQIINQTQKEIIPEIPPSLGLQFSPLLDLRTVSEDDLQRNSLRVLLSYFSNAVVKMQNKTTKTDTVINWSHYNTAEFSKSNYRFLSLQSENYVDQNTLSFREVMVKMNQVVLLVSEHLNNENWDAFEDFKDIINYYESKKIPLFLITRSSYEAQQIFKKKLGSNVIILQNYDDVGLKMVSRANPALVLIEKGKVIGKHTRYSLPDIEDLKSILSNQK